MADEQSEVIVAKAKDFWTRNSRIILGIGTILLLLVGGFFVYKKFFKEPKEQKAKNEIFKAEEYYRLDSSRLALNGDGQYPGFLSIISKYGGTKAGNLAHYYAGVSYLKLDDYNNAIKHLKKFDGDGAEQIQQRAYKLLGDAYGDQGNHKEALDYYKKAAHYFEEDEAASAEALDLAAYLAATVLKDNEQAISLYKELKEKYPASTQGRTADRHLAQLGVYNVN
jgi:tetratricopeptide (TPR) repeat protein